MVNKIAYNVVEDGFDDVRGKIANRAGLVGV
jgi:hypothetical protein